MPLCAQISKNPQLSGHKRNVHARRNDRHPICRRRFSGACFAEFSVTVTCLDKDEGAQQGRRKIPLYEPDLDQVAVRAADHQ